MSLNLNYYIYPVLEPIMCMHITDISLLTMYIKQTRIFTAIFPEYDHLTRRLHWENKVHLLTELKMHLLNSVVMRVPPKSCN